MPDTDVRTLLARNMKRFRALSGLSQMALADRVGCSTTLIGNIETMRRFPSPENLNRIAAALGVHPSQLFADDHPLLDRIQRIYEVRERLENSIRKAIDESLAGLD